MTTPNNLKHAVFETSRHGDGGAEVQIVGAFGTLGIVVPASGKSEHLTEHETLEALRHALEALKHAKDRLEEHIAKLDPDGETEEETEDKPKAPIPTNARFA